MTNGNYTIVVVDDDEDLLRMMVFALQSEGWEVKTLSNGQEALGYLLDENNLKATQLLILDRLLPDMDGLDILNQLKEKYPKQLPMVLILSVLAADQDISRGFEAGALDYLTKPFNLNVLVDKSKALLARYKSP